MQFEPSNSDPSFIIPKPRLNLKTVRCYECNGTGRVLEMGEETCPNCVGTGRDKNSDLWAEPCRKCNGKGRVPYCRRGRTPCSRCNGTGLISY